MTKKTRTTRKETSFTNTGKAIERKDMIITTDSLEYTIFKDYRFEEVILTCKRQEDRES